MCGLQASEDAKFALLNMQDTKLSIVHRDGNWYMALAIPDLGSSFTKDDTVKSLNVKLMNSFLIYATLQRNCQ